MLSGTSSGYNQLILPRKGLSVTNPENNLVLSGCSVVLPPPAPVEDLTREQVKAQNCTTQDQENGLEWKPWKLYL